MSQRTARRSKPVPLGHRSGRSEAPKAKRVKTSAPSTATPATFQEDEGPDERKWVFSMDYGTKTLSLAYRITTPGQDATIHDLWDVHFSETAYWAPQKAAWGPDGEFYWGYDVDKRLKSKEIKQESVIELWKLLLYKDHATSDIAKRVETQLGERTLDELLSTHFKAVIDTAKEQMKRAAGLEFSREDVDNLPKQLFLSVPRMWKAPANRRMTQAAKEAGIPYVELVYEPQCAAAYYTYNIKFLRQSHMDIGEVLVIADVGGGTGDFVSYEIRSDCDDGAKVQLRDTGKAEGALCGSQFVNEAFLNWFKTNGMANSGGFNATYKALGYTAPELINRASAEFERIKQSFAEPQPDDIEHIMIPGAQGAQRKSLHLELKSETIQGFFDPVIEKIVECIDKQRKSQHATTLIIPGGFGRSQYLLDQLTARYYGILRVLGQKMPEVGFYTPVSKGALLRYKDVLTRGLPSTDSFGIGQVEEFDEYIHVDAMYQPGEKMHTGRVCKKACKNTTLIENDPYNDDMEVVYDRWLPLLPQGTLLTANQTFTTEAWQMYTALQNDKTMTVQVYWTEARIPQHAPIYQGASHKSSPIRDCIEPWGTPLECTLPDLAAAGFELKTSPQGEVYEIYYRLLLECNGANIKLRWQICVPGHEPYDENGHERRHADVRFIEATDDGVFEICTAAFNPYPRASPS